MKEKTCHITTFRSDSNCNWSLLTEIVKEKSIYNLTATLKCEP